VILSRASPKVVRRLFELEVTEIADGTVKIEAFAREPGYRTKIAVTSTDQKVDPVGACVGARGSRVKTIVRELNGEKIDIVKYHADPKEMIIEAFKPAVPREIIIDEVAHRILLKVATDDLAIAIGRKGQNARLTSRLLGWRLDIEEFRAAGDNPRETAINVLVKTFAFDPAIAGRLVDMGINSPAAFEGVAAEDLVGGGFTADEAQDVITRVTT
jgi:N utilization substance protein A